MTKLIKGSRLTPDQRNEVLRAFVHRNTVEHPFKLSGGLPTTDAAWLAAHAFYFTDASRLDRRRRHCEPSYLAD